jgi:hypothetical protein
MKNIIIYTNIVLIAILTLQIQGFAQCVQCSGGTATGTAASIIGLNNTASGSYSFAGGVNSLASGGVSFAFGTSARAEAPYAVALGGETKASFANSFAIGTFCSAEASNSFIIGTGVSDMLKMTNTVPYSLVMGFGSTKPTLFIGPSNGINLTGKIGIGDVTNPQSKLHIKADDGEAAEVFIEPHPTSTTATLWLGTKQYGVRKTASRLDFKTAPGGVYVFNDGNVGIGTFSPTQKLEVSGNLKTVGFIMTGGAAAGKVLTSDASGQAAWQEIPEDGHWMVNGDDLYRLNGKVGIGTSTPSVKLEVTGNIRVNSLVFNNADLQENFITGKYEPLIYGSKSGGEIGGSSSLILQAGGTPINNNRHIFFRTADQTRIFIHHNGNVGIGTTNTSDAKLTVAGRILAEEMKIILSVPQSDFVFEEDYELMPLSELDQFVRTNKHLPGVPSAAEFAQDGYSVGEMDDLLLRKVEELTLYVIELKNEVTKLKHDYGVPKNNEQ